MIPELVQPPLTTQSLLTDFVIRGCPLPHDLFGLAIDLDGSRILVRLVMPEGSIVENLKASVSAIND